MSNLSAPIAFAYSALAVEDAAAVRRATDRLRAAITSTARLVVSAGLSLLRVRRRLKPYRGAWDAYVKAEVPWSRGQVYRLMRAARVFRTVAEVDGMAPTALYVLTWPTSPPAATREALSLVRDGQRVDAATARRLVAKHRPAPPVADPDAADEPIIVGEIPPEPVTLGALMVEALSRFRVLHISQGDDDDEEDGDGSQVGVTAYPLGEGSAIIFKRRGSLAEALEAAMGRGPADKTCRTCRRAKPIGEFCLNKTSDDGRHPVCRACVSQYRADGKKEDGRDTRRRPQPAG